MQDRQLKLKCADCGHGFIGTAFWNGFFTSIQDPCSKCGKREFKVVGCEKCADGIDGDECPGCGKPKNGGRG